MKPVEEVNSGNGRRSIDLYNSMWCFEKHEQINKEIDHLDNRINKLDNRLWAILVLLFVNCGGIIAVLLKL